MLESRRCVKSTFMCKLLVQMVESSLFFLLRASQSVVLIQFSGLCSVTQLTSLLIKGRQIPKLCAVELQVPLNPLCQKRCKRTSWAPSFSLSSLSSHSVYLSLIFLSPALLFSLPFLFLLKRCHFGFISQQVFASLGTSLERREH